MSEKTITESAINPFTTSGTSPPENVPSNLNEFGTLTPNANADIHSQQADPPRESVPKTSSEVISQKAGLITVKDLAALYGISRGSIYSLIRTDSSFPVVNLGLKKKFMIEFSEYEAWIKIRSKKDHAVRFNEPTTEDLLKLRKNKP